MNASETSLQTYFQEELQALREDAIEFGHAYPSAARALNIGRTASSDPQVELLLESFAYLTGRLRYQVEAGLASVPNFLTEFLYPHLAAPIPTSFIVGLAVKPDGANFASAVTLAQGRMVSAMAQNNLNEQYTCRFRTSCATQLVPLQIVACEMLDLDAEHPDPLIAKVMQISGQAPASALRVSFRCVGTEAIKKLNLDSIRVHINSDDKDQFGIYEWLALNLDTSAENAVLIYGDDPLQSMSKLPATCFRWAGFDDEEALYEVDPNTHPGLRLLQEYFAFQQKFMFFDLNGLPLQQAGDSFSLLFLSQQSVDVAPSVLPSSLRLNCAPVVNLFSQRLEPFLLDQTQFEYRLQGDVRFHRFCEIHSIQALTSTRPGAARAIQPYFHVDDISSGSATDYFYTARRSADHGGTIPGTETYVSFLDKRFTLDQPLDEVVGGQAWCTNRTLPELLQVGDSLRVEGAAPIAGVTVLSKPTPHQSPQLIGEHPWALASQLVLNHLSLADGPAALAALKRVLAAHVPAGSTQGLQWIDGLVSISCSRVRHHRGADAWRGFTTGLRVELTINPVYFDGSSAVLFGEVLRHFFTLYCPVNTTVELAMLATNKKGVLKEWPPILGTQTLI
jgi:type VI secretion system protein ImpG